MFTASSLDPYLQQEQATYFIQAALSLARDGSSKMEGKKDERCEDAVTIAFHQQKDTLLISQGGWQQPWTRFTCGSWENEGELYQLSV